MQMMGADVSTMAQDLMLEAICMVSPASALVPEALLMSWEFYLGTEAGA